MTLRLPHAACRPIAAAVLSLAVFGCTSAGSSTGTSAPSANPSVAAPSAAASVASPSASLTLSAHVDATVAGLEEALALYRSGNVQGALDEVAETYEDHFEQIEEPLEKVNDDLKEDLEGLIATKLRAAITAKATIAEIEALVLEGKTKLAIAKGLLK